MGIFVNGNSVVGVYVAGQEVNEVYENGALVYTKKQPGKTGWEQGTNTRTITVTSNDGNSVAGTITFTEWLYFDNDVVTTNRWDRTSKNLSTTTNGIVSLSLGKQYKVKFADAGNTWYSSDSSGSMRLSGYELNKITSISPNSSTTTLSWSSQSITSYFTWPIYGAALTGSGTSVSSAKGWTIAANRSSRMSKAATTVTVANLNAPASTGTFPIYYVGESGTTAMVPTCAANVHTNYDGKSIRLAGFITLSGGSITAIESHHKNTGSALTKSVSGTTVNVGAGWGTDTGSCTVYTPAISYNFNDMIYPATDRSHTETVTTYTENNKWLSAGLSSWVAGINSSGSASSSKPAWSTGSGGNKTYYANQAVGWNIATPFTGPGVILFRADFWGTGPNLGSGATTKGTLQVLGPNGISQVLYSTSVSYSSSGMSVQWTVPAGTQVGSITLTGFKMGSINTTAGMQATAACAWSSSTSTTTVIDYTGVAQKRDLYSVVTRATGSETSTATSGTSTGTSSAYTSYIKIGTINVARNAKTGTIT